jgi:hypothetical protein
MIKFYKKLEIIMIRKMTLSTVKNCLLPLSLSILLSGCASFGKGVAEAFLEKSDAEDTRACQVRGKSFEGIAPGLEKSQGKTKVLMVHGVGDRLPGYSTEFLEKLAKELHLTAKSSSYKDIKLISFSDPEEKLGDLRISRLQNESGESLFLRKLLWASLPNKRQKLRDR